MPLSMEEKERIANLGGHFTETGANSWVGVKIRTVENKYAFCELCGSQKYRKNFTKISETQLKCPKCGSIISVEKEKYKYGVVTQDLNGATRRLTVRFEDNMEEVIEMNNVGPDLDYVHDYEWLAYPKENRWLRF